MKRLLILVLTVLLLLTACNAPVGNDVVKSEYPERQAAYTVAAAKKSPIVFQSDVFGEIRYQLEEIDYLRQLPPTFELRADGLYHVGVKLKDDQGLTDYLTNTKALGDFIGEDESGPIFDVYDTTELSSEITIVKVDMTVTRTKEGNLPDFDANDEFPLDCLKIYTEINGNKFDNAYSPLAIGGINVTYNDNVKLKTGVPTSVTLYYAVKTMDFRHKTVSLSVQIADVADLHSKDISYISLMDSQLISITTKNGNNGTIEGNGYFGIKYKDDIYYISNDYTTISSKYNDRYSGVGIYKQQEGEDEEVEIIPHSFIADKGSFDALYHNGVIYFAVRDGDKYKNAAEHSLAYQDYSIVLYSYDFESGTLRPLYTFDMGANKYINMNYFEDGLLYVDVYYYKNYIGLGPTKQLMDEEYAAYIEKLNENTVDESFAINPKNKCLYRIDNYGKLIPLFSVSQVKFVGTGEGEAMSAIVEKSSLTHQVDNVTVYDSLENTGMQLQNIYDEDTRFLLVDMTVSYANPSDTSSLHSYKFDLHASTYPNMAEIAKFDYPYGALAPVIIAVDNVPDTLGHCEKQKIQILIAAHKDYIANRDVFLTEDIEPSTSSLSPPTQFIQLLNTQYIDYTEQSVNLFGLEYGGYHNIVYKGGIYSYTNTVKTDYSGDKYVEIRSEGRVHLAGEITGYSKDKALFSSRALMKDGILYYATKSNTAYQGANYKEWTKGKLQIEAERLDTSGLTKLDEIPRRFLVELDADPNITDIIPLEVTEDSLIFELYRTVDGVETVEKYSVALDSDIPASLTELIPVEQEQP